MSSIAPLGNTTPQRELDALIAECLFGWRWLRQPTPCIAALVTVLPEGERFARIQETGLDA